MHWIFAIGRHGGRHGFRHGGGFMGGRGRGDMPGSRRLGSAELQLVILSLLADRPAHGYELIKTLEERSGGFYSPSPGVVYPALTYLEEIGYASVEPDGTRKLYRISAAGAAHLAANRGEVDAIFAAMTRIAGRMDQVRDAFAGIDEAGPADEVHRARHALRHALRQKRGSDAGERRRIAAILDRATAEILGN